MRKACFITPLFLLAALALASLMVGSSSYPAWEVARTLLGKGDDPALSYIVASMRLPRTIAAVLCGMVLATSGCLFQAVLRNPMADPFVLGVSSGGSLGAAIGLSFGLVNLTAPAMVGGFASAFLVLLLSLRHQSQTRLILTGVALNYLCSSLMTLCMMLDYDQYQRIIFWTMGSFSAVTFQGVRIVAICYLLSLIPLLPVAGSLDLLLLDDASALSMGLDIHRTRILVIAIATFPVAVSVAWFGVIGFVGLLAPHVARLMVGPSHKRLLPLCSLLGADLLLASDLACRVILPSGELPAGVITSLLGTPLLILMLRRGSVRHG